MRIQKTFVVGRTMRNEKQSMGPAVCMAYIFTLERKYYEN